MVWTGTNPVTIGNATKKSDYDKAWDNVTYLHDLAFVSDVAAAGTDTYTLGASPALAAYVDGAFYLCKITNANTSATPTLNINSLGAKTIVKYGNTALIAGDIPAGHAAIFRYDLSLNKMILCNPAVANDAITNAKLDNMAQNTIKGRVTASTGDPEDLTAANVRTIINVADGANNYSHPNHSGNVTSTGDGATVIAALAVAEGMLASSAVSQGKLKTSTGEVSSAETVYTDLTLPGGEYGFYPQLKTGNGAYPLNSIIADNVASTSYVANIALKGSTIAFAYAQQRYVSASGRDHWIFLLMAKATGKVLASYQAPDHPSANTQLLHADIPHPFGSYDPARHDIVLADNDILTEIKPLIDRRTGILEVINRRCIIDEAKSAEYAAREIIKINEFPDDPYPGFLARQVMDTPQWANIVIKAEKISLELFAIEMLPENIQYRKLYFNSKT